MSSKAKKIPNAKIKGLRAERNLTQAEMAKILGISEVSYLQRENGKSDWRSSEMFALRKLSKLSLDELFPA